MRKNMGIGIVLALLLVVSSQVLAVPPTDVMCKGKCDVFPFKAGDVFKYDVENNIGETWQMYVIVIGETKLLNKTNYATIEEWGYNDPWSYEIMLLRSTSTEVFYYEGGGREVTVWQNAPVGTTWTYEERDGDIKERKVVAIESVTVPAGSFSDCLKTCQRKIDDPPDAWITCEWVKPGFGMVKEVDFYTDNAPAVKLLNSKTQLQYP